MKDFNNEVDIFELDDEFGLEDGPFDLDPIVAQNLIYGVIDCISDGSDYFGHISD